MSYVGKIIKYSKMLGSIRRFAYFYFLYYCYRKEIKLKNKIVWFYFDKYQTKFGARTNTSDIAMLWALCLAGEYDLPWADDFSPGVIIDGGCNVGYFSMIMARRFPKAKIIAVEPDKDNYDMMLQNFKLLGRHNIIPILGGCWNKDTMLAVHNAGSAMGVTVSESLTGDIRALRVETILKEAGEEQIDLFKIDIEGSEWELFSGDCESWIRKPSCYIVEPHDYYHPGITGLLERRLGEDNGYRSFRHGEDILFFKSGVLKSQEGK